MQPVCEQLDKGYSQFFAFPISREKSMSKLSEKEKEACSICQDDEEVLDTKLSGCTHSFHFECIRTWAAKENTCPLCKVRFTSMKQNVKGKMKTTKVKKKDQVPEMQDAVYLFDDDDSDELDFMHSLFEDSYDTDDSFVDDDHGLLAVDFEWTPFPITRHRRNLGDLLSEEEESVCDDEAEILEMAMMESHFQAAREARLLLTGSSGTARVPATSHRGRPTSSSSSARTRESTRTRTVTSSSTVTRTVNSTTTTTRTVTSSSTATNRTRSAQPTRPTTTPSSSSSILSQRRRDTRSSPALTAPAAIGSSRGQPEESAESRSALRESLLETRKRAIEMSITLPPAAPVPETLRRLRAREVSGALTSSSASASASASRGSVTQNSVTRRAESNAAQSSAAAPSPSVARRVPPPLPEQERVEVSAPKRPRVSRTASWKDAAWDVMQPIVNEAYRNGKITRDDCKKFASEVTASLPTAFGIEPSSQVLNNEHEEWIKSQISKKISQKSSKQ